MAWRRKGKQTKTAAPSDLNGARTGNAAAARMRTTQPFRDLEWQEKIRRYDAEGPGIVGWYLDFRSYLAAQA